MPADFDDARGSHRRPRRRVMVSIIGLVVAAALPGTFAGASTAEPVQPRPRLLVIGDSIILGTGDNIAAALPDWDVVFDAAVSRSTAAGLDVVAEHGTEFTAVVVSLGANDGGSPGVFTPRVAALLDALAGVPHVIWLTIHEVRPYYAETNAIIRAQAAGHPNTIVADWNAAVRAGDVGGDGLHLTGQGATNMAAWTAAVVRLASAPPPTTTTSTTSTTSTTTTTTTTTTVVATSTVVASTSPRATAASPADDTATGSRAGWAIGVVGLLVLAVGGGVFAARRR